MAQHQILPRRFAAVSPIRITLRSEGAGAALASMVLYGQLGGSWAVFTALLLVPDIVMLGYLAGPRIGAAVYNLGHSYLGPLMLAGIGAVTDGRIALLVALIWGAHIGMDRALGYGLKYPSGFRDTHLGRV